MSDPPWLKLWRADIWFLTSCTFVERTRVHVDVCGFGYWLDFAFIGLLVVVHSANDRHVLMNLHATFTESALQVLEADLVIDLMRLVIADFDYRVRMMPACLKLPPDAVDVEDVQIGADFHARPMRQLCVANEAYVTTSSLWRFCGLGYRCTFRVQAGQAHGFTFKPIALMSAVLKFVAKQVLLWLGIQNFSGIVVVQHIRFSVPASCSHFLLFHLLWLRSHCKSAYFHSVFSIYSTKSEFYFNNKR